MSLVALNTKRIIKERCLLQKKVAIDAGYNPKKFSDMMNDRKIITDDDIVNISNALQVTPNELFKHQDSA